MHLKVQSLLGVEPVVARPLHRLDDLAHALVHREHNRLARRDAEDTRSNALVERLDALLPPHVLRDGRDALERGLAWLRGCFLQTCQERNVSSLEGHR